VINSKDEITVKKLKECSAAGKSISETLQAQLAVIPSLLMRREVRKCFGFYRRDAKGGDDKDAEYREGKMLMYGKEEIDRLKDFGTTPFKEVIMGCKIDSDCAGWSPKIRQWWKGGKPVAYKRKMALPVVDLLKRSEVEKTVKPVRSFEAWKKKEMMKVKVTERLCILAKGDGKTSYQVMPSKKEILDRLAWVTSEEGKFDPAIMAVHLVLYFAHSLGGVMRTDGRPQEAPLKEGLRLVEELLQYDDSLGIVVVPDDQTLEVLPKELKVVSKRFAALVESTTRVSGEQMRRKYAGVWSCRNCM
jgi:hypothetical protein